MQNISLLIWTSNKEIKHLFLCKFEKKINIARDGVARKRGVIRVFQWDQLLRESETFGSYSRSDFGHTWFTIKYILKEKFQFLFSFYFISLDGRMEDIYFDKVVSRIDKLAYGLNSNYVDPVSRNFNVWSRKNWNVTRFLLISFINQSSASVLIPNASFGNLERAQRRSMKRHDTLNKCNNKSLPT